MGVDGVPHVVGTKYLQDYINAYAFRWNHRNDETPMFLQMLSRIVPSLRV
jgi:transposase